MRRKVTDEEVKEVITELSEMVIKELDKLEKAEKEYKQAEENLCLNLTEKQRVFYRIFTEKRDAYYKLLNEDNENI